MSLRRAVSLAMLLVATAAVLATAVPALAADATALPPDQAQSLASTGPETSGSTTTAVDGQTALDAAALPGAETSVEAGVSPDAAVGLATLTESVLPQTRPVCWANSYWHQWGTWPYQQRITDTTYWCAVYGNHITYRTSTTTASGTLCAISWRAGALIAGGVGPGYHYFTHRASGGFACPTIIPWITIHTSHHEDIKRTDRGVTTLVGTG